VGEAANTLALVLERLDSAPFDALMVERLWKPLGNGSLSFVQRGGDERGDGIDAGCCIRARLGDWMRIGVVLANDGVFEGNQLTPPHYVNLMLKPTHQDSPRGFFTRVDGDFAARDVARLESDGKQRLWVVPSLQLVILRVGDEPPPSQGWDEAMIPDSIIRGTSGWKPKSAGEGVDPKKFAPH
jgi:CubicO group peptidase (beta-lactamase class C family)